MDITNFRDREAFVVGADGMSETGELAVFDSIGKLNEHLNLISPATEPNILVLHGILMPAEAIPGDIGTDDAYIVVRDPGDAEAGCIFEASTEGGVETVTEEIEALLDNSLDSQNPYDSLDIGDIFILYGYELNLGYGVNPEEIDEAIVESCRITAGEAKEIMEGGWDA